MMATHINYPTLERLEDGDIEAEIDRVIDLIRKDSGLGLHLGAGRIRIPGLINCDMLDENADRRGDCTKLDEFADCSVDLIETHHMIEHLSFEEIEKGLCEWFRVLKPLGYLVITCPDITAIARYWLELTEKYDTNPCPEQRNYAMKMIYGSQEHAGMFHKSGYDKIKMEEILASHGFMIEFSYTPYPSRSTPSLLVIARKKR